MKTYPKPRVDFFVIPPYMSSSIILISHLGVEEGDTTPEYQPPEISDMDVKPMMKTKEEYR